jgi:hypothetical protein
MPFASLTRGLTRGLTCIRSRKTFLVGAFLTARAEIEARANDALEAVKTLRRLSSIPAGLTVSIQGLKTDPVWDPIRNDPGFQQLLGGKEQIGPLN